MKFKIFTGSLLVCTLILSTLCIPLSYAEDSKKNILEYKDIAARVTQGNLQLNASRASLSEMEDRNDDAADAANNARNALIGLIRSIDAASGTMSDILSEPDVDPDVAAVADAVKLSLSLAKGNLNSQLGSMSGSGNSNSYQLQTAELNLEQAQKSLVNSAQNMFILYHQLSNGIGQSENNRVILQSRANAAKIKLRYGLISKVEEMDSEASLQDLDASFGSLVHQRDATLLQIKNLLGLKPDADLALGDMPEADRAFIGSIDPGKDSKDAMTNAISIRIKNLEYSSDGSTSNYYDLKQKENDASISFTKQYQKLLEKNDTLQASESKLNTARAKLMEGQIRYKAGNMSLLDLHTLENDVKSQELTVESNLASLFCETENYKAMKAGML